MHFRWLAILGLAAALTVAAAPQSAEAARGDRSPVARPNATRPAPIARPAIQQQGSRRAVSTARGGHTQPRATARSTGRERGVIASRSRSGQGAITGGRNGHQRQHSALNRSSYRAGYQSAVLRGQGSRFASMSACSTVRGRRVCGGSRTVAMRWSGGLAPAAGQQSSCPDGTMATLAVGHENVVRCVPM